MVKNKIVLLDPYSNALWGGGEVTEELISLRCGSPLPRFCICITEFDQASSTNIRNLNEDGDGARDKLYFYPSLTTTMFWDGGRLRHRIREDICKCTIHELCELYLYYVLLCWGCPQKVQVKIFRPTLPLRI